ncbi:hypothetical protein JT306_12145 [Salmonella enterica subsp. enterica serovar Kentucky]|nr:hypothetical protein [Salmonella enterica subsp. enterica serovar Kentucky]
MAAMTPAINIILNVLRMSFLFTAACRPFRNAAAEFLAKARRYNEGKVKRSGGFFGAWVGIVA